MYKCMELWTQWVAPSDRVEPAMKVGGPQVSCGFHAFDGMPELVELEDAGPARIPPMSWM
jgi:hypothetical protein